MEEENSLAFVYKSLLESKSIPEQLRNKEGLDESRFAELVSNIRFLINIYKGQKSVPKKLALCMVDIYSSFSFRNGFYNEYETEKIEDAGIELQDLANELFS